MRVDKLLWCFRYFKTRSLATEIVNKNRIKINDVTAKASRDVMVGDTIDVVKDQIRYQFKVLQLPVSRLGAKLLPLYLIDTTPQEELEKKQLKSLAQDYYREKGEGRPTKRDRRELDEYLNDDFLFEDFN